MAEKYTSKELSEWLLQKAAEAKSPVTARKHIVSMDHRGRSTTMIGKLYFFKYDPLWKHKLVEYDKFPMCMPIERYNNGFLGLNLHYLSVGARISLLTDLTSFASDGKMDENTRFLVNWNKIKGFSNLYSASLPCVHRYIFNNVRSKFIEIYPDEYSKAVQLPVEDWVFKQ